MMSVGYLDRFTGVVEAPFTDFCWEDIASQDWDTLAIPQHRIQYFKWVDLAVPIDILTSAPIGAFEVKHSALLGYYE